MRQYTMRFWKIEPLKAELIRDDLPPSQALQYYVAAGALTILLNGLPSFETNAWDSISTVGSALLLVAGGYLCFFANGGADGKDFLGRFVALGWVLGIRLLVLLMIPGMLFGIALESYFLGQIPDDSTFAEIALTLVFEAFYYWRLAFHIDSVANGAAV